MTAERQLPVDWILMLWRPNTVQWPQRPLLSTLGTNRLRKMIQDVGTNRTKRARSSHTARQKRSNSGKSHLVKQLKRACTRPPLPAGVHWYSPLVSYSPVDNFFCRGDLDNLRDIGTCSSRSKQLLLGVECWIGGSMRVLLWIKNLVGLGDTFALHFVP